MKPDFDALRKAFQDGRVSMFWSEEGGLQCPVFWLGIDIARGNEEGWVHINPILYQGGVSFLDDFERVWHKVDDLMFKLDVIGTFNCMQLEPTARWAQRVEAYRMALLSIERAFAHENQR